MRLIKCEPALIYARSTLNKIQLGRLRVQAELEATILSSRHVDIDRRWVQDWLAGLRPRDLRSEERPCPFARIRVQIESATEMDGANQSGHRVSSSRFCLHNKRLPCVSRCWEAWFAIRK
jgi:hypothetical protein